MYEGESERASEQVLYLKEAAFTLEYNHGIKE